MQNWDADELMDNPRKGTKEANKRSYCKGIEPTGNYWLDREVTYDANPIIVFGSVRRHPDIGTNEPLNEQGVNYNTYLLGREGYFS